MAIDSTSLPEPAPSWFTPKRLLVVFCVINMVNYVDRGAIASNGVNGSPRSCTESGVCSDGSGIQGDFDLTNFRDGVISSAFMVGLLVASPIFASLAKSINPFRLIGVGLSVWTLAAAGCGVSVDFWSITVCRMLVGVGEASFISLAAPFIDDNAPVTQRTSWLGIFYMCIPTGVALGYVYGGWVGTSFGWRYAFFGEAILMLPFAILGFMMKPLQMKGMSNDKNVPGSLTEEFSDHTSKKPFSYGSFTSNQLYRFWQDIKDLLHEKIYVVNVLGYIAYNFVIGAYSYWGPKAGYSIYQMNNADILFGGITIVGGIVGTLGGSIILDRMNSTIPNAFKGPVNFVCLHTVKPSLRPLSMAMSTVSIHIFGDVPSAPLVGALQDEVDNWRISALILTSVLFLAAGIWFIGIFLHGVDRYSEDSEHPLATVVEQSDATPLLKNKAVDTAASAQL
ncbi:probable sphingolipid transporter spinster homolog 2 isoform X2 [Cynara cardunculus var. scolymus]|uniref:probable sphingolipid transporter spinster homolog 2 isoform X2 n=1 Tax=Cynara cardunculus var. scolymus TaxID=59895 RepID=UPI000D623066|nr:probable sphingolipid transporter spinster homolog 2 isoform X2 [Cynara cardunculus var. scolymus]